jgi:IclR family transcriptional regulator, acetate operon repressor
MNPVPTDTSPRVLHRALRLVGAIAERNDHGIGLTELSRETGISKATCYRIVSVLREWRWVTLDEQSKRYRLGLGFVAVASRAASATGLHEAVAEMLAGLSRETEETAGLDVFVDDEIMVLEEIQGPNLIAQVPRPVPRRMPAYCTSTGKVFLADLPRDEVLRTYRTRYKKQGPGAPATLPEFADTLNLVREQGYAVAFDEYEEGAAAIAAPVYDADGALEYAIWIGGPTFRLTHQRIQELAPFVIRAADECALRLQDASRTTRSARARASNPRSDATIRQLLEGRP